MELLTPDLDQDPANTGLQLNVGCNSGVFVSRAHWEAVRCFGRFKFDLVLLPMDRTPPASSDFCETQA